MQLHPSSTQAISDTKDHISATLRSVSRYVLVVVFGLIPILFLPVKYVPLGYSKTFLVVIGVLIALIFFSLAVLRSGTISLKAPLALWAMWGIVAVTLLSTILSGDIKDSLMGEALPVHSALFVTLLALIATVSAVLCQVKTHVMRLYMLLTASTLLLGLYHILRLLFGPSFLSLGIFTANISSPVGGWNDLALFLGLSVILSVIALEQLPLPRMGRILFSAVITIALVMLAVINFFAVWIVLGVVSLIMLMYALTKDRFKLKADPMGLAKSDTSASSVVATGAIFIVSALFIIGGSFLGSRVSDVTDISYVEVRPSVVATLGIAKDVYAENAFVGTGPNRFSDAWRMYKDRSINDTIFWNTDFDAGNGYITTMFVTTGVFGVVAWLTFLVLFFYGGIKMLFRSAVNDRFWYFIGTSSFVAAIYLWGMSFLYVPGAAVLMLAAVCTGMTFVAYQALLPNALKGVNLTTDKRTGIVLIAIVMLIIIGSVASIYNIGRHYFGLYTFNEALSSISQGVSVSEIEVRIADAFELSNSDSFANQIALYQLSRMNVLLGTQEPTAAQQQQFQNAVANGVNAAQLAVREDETNPVNWATLGSIYSVLATANIEGADERAIEAYGRAREYSPLNPRYALLEAELALRVGNLDEAKTKANESIRLKPNYTNALLFLAQLDIAQGDVAAAISRTLALISLEPGNAARFYQLGVLYTSNNQLDNALTAFERAVATDPGYANARYLLALGYIEKGQTADAVAQLEVVRDLNPDNKQVEALIVDLNSGAATDLQLVEEVAEPVPDTDRGDVSSSELVPDTDLLSPVNITAVSDSEIESSDTEAVEDSSDDEVTEPGV